MLLFISHLASWLRTRRFSEPTFRPSRSHKSLEKHSVSRLSYLFLHLHLLSSYSFSSTLLSSNLSLLSASSLLCFSSVHIVGSLTSKLPSTTTNTQLHFTTLHYTKLHYTTLHYTTLHYTTFHYTPLRYTTLHYTTLH